MRALHGLLPLLLVACGGPVPGLDLDELTTLEGEHHYVFSGVDVYDNCSMSWQASGVISDEPCDDCDLVFAVDMVFLAEAGDCYGGYGYPVGEDEQLHLGFALEHEQVGPVVGPVEYGELDWGSGSVIGAASASAEYLVGEEPPSMEWDYLWRDPWGYYFAHTWYGTLTLE